MTYIKSTLARMKADEARALAEAAQTGKLDEIYGIIKSAAEKGDDKERSMVP